jgi:hypothetical protein
MNEGAAGLSKKSYAGTTVESHPSKNGSAVTLKVLHRPLMSFRGFAGSEGPKIAPLLRFWIFLA